MGRRLIIVFAVFSLSLHAQSKKKAPEPQLAGMGLSPQILPLTHGCTINYGRCLDGCSGVTGANCLGDCVKDCNVCALDTGEDDSLVCKK